MGEPHKLSTAIPPLERYIESLLNEAPIDTLELHGDWSPQAKPRGYDKPSIGILTSPVGVEKIKQKWSRVNQVFDMYFVRSSKGWKHTEVGEVKPEFVRDELGLNIPINHDKVTMIFTNNKGSEKVPMTPWTLAHRFGHACQRGSYNDRSNPYNQISAALERALTKIAQIGYGIGRFKDQWSSYNYSFSNGGPNKEIIFKQICQNLGTMKSARDKNLRNYGEFIYEMLAQYMITGRVTLKRDLGRVLATRFAWGNPQGYWKNRLTPEQEAAIDEIISSLEMDAENYAHETLERAVGRIYVM